jgi:hypothetical protein
VLNTRAGTGKDLVDGLGCACGERDVGERGEVGDVPQTLESVNVYRCVTIDSGMLSG